MQVLSVTTCGITGAEIVEAQSILLQPRVGANEVWYGMTGGAGVGYEGELCSCFWKDHSRLGLGEFVLEDEGVQLLDWDEEGRG
mmetsp:Transcript_24211/g.27074  ORF Transcript_24211/g.27074 Transcript_24211/m.27074 type:complete len:84 (-) Transcript_24211:896-1147(-)